jgi:hypothetical protein
VHKFNNPPVVKIRAHQRVNTGASVTLDGSASGDPDGNSISFSWKQALGPAVSLSSTSEAMVTFMAPANGTTLAFELTVSNGRRSSVGKVAVSVHPVGQAARITEVHQRPIKDDPAVNGHLGDTWTLRVPAGMPPQPPDVDPTEGAFALLSAVQFAPVVEDQLSPAARREVELQVSGPSVLLGTVRWIGTKRQLRTSLLLDGSSLAAGTGYSFAGNRGGSSLNARTTGGGRATLTVTNPSGVTVKVKIVLGALGSLHKPG